LSSGCYTAPPSMHAAERETVFAIAIDTGMIFC